MLASHMLALRVRPVGHSALYNVPQEGSGAAADGWSSLASHVLERNKLSWGMDKT